MKTRRGTQPPRIPLGSVADILQFHFDRSPTTITPVGGGLTNEVFEAMIGRDAVIIRLSREPAKLQVFMKEQWAITHARKQGVPTAEVLEVSNEVGGLPYMISHKVPGRLGTGFRDKRALLNSLGKYAAVINSIPTHDFGPVFDWTRNKLSRHQTWKDYLITELHVEDRVESLAAVLEPANLRKLRKQLDAIKQWKTKPSLNHGDIRLKNVIVDEKRNIVAILDWEDCTSNIAPFWDLSIALHDLTMDEKEMFLHGYGVDLQAYMKMAPAIKALNILNYAGSLRHALEQNDKTQLLSLRARLNGSFDLYSL